MYVGAADSMYACVCCMSMQGAGHDGASYTSVCKRSAVQDGVESRTQWGPPCRIHLVGPLRGHSSYAFT